MTEHLLSIILPVYNQADHIEAVVHEYEAALAELPYPHELLLVVNGSRDRSLELCEALAARHPSVRVLHSVQGGWGLAVRLGLREAHGTILCYTNSARTSPQDLVLLLVYAIANPGVVIKANRKVREKWQRRLGSLLYNLECRALFDLSYWDINGTPKVFPATMPGLLALTRDDDLIDAEFNAICRRQGYPMLEVPIFSSRRYGGSSTTSYKSALRMYFGAYKLWRLMERGASR
ncbi:MAG TPA: glycosyltransferase [Chloroflexaceae bacterium]|nr:glycosyltransferase [Chloroflexaceae bacterium]